jgi:hypothetical protein
MDATNDGLLTRDDAVLLADEMCAVLAPDAAPPVHQDIQDAYRQLWDELQRFADVDADAASPAVGSCADRLARAGRSAARVA